MKLTSPQRLLIENDEELRRKQRRSFGTKDVTSIIRHYIDLLRKGKISHTDIQTAAAFDDEIAKQVCREIKEMPPTIESIEDLINLFGLYRDQILTILTALYSNKTIRRHQGHSSRSFVTRRHLGAVGEFNTLREMLGWSIGQVRGRNFRTDEISIFNILRRALQDIVNAGFSLDNIKEILRPYFTHPEIRQEKIPKLGQRNLEEFFN